MRARTLNLGIGAYSALVLYLSVASFLHHMGGANLPFAFEPNSLELVVMQLTVLILGLIGLIAKAWEG